MEDKVFRVLEAVEITPVSGEVASGTDTARGKQRIWRRREGTEGEDRRDENGEKEGAWYSW